MSKKELSKKELSKKELSKKELNKKELNKKELNKKELNKKAFVSLTSDFGAQGQGGGLMEGVILSICPHAYVIHLTHELPPFNLIAAARTLEQVTFLPVGAHVCI